MPMVIGFWFVVLLLVLEAPCEQALSPALMMLIRQKIISNFLIGRVLCANTALPPFVGGDEIVSLFCY